MTSKKKELDQDIAFEAEVVSADVPIAEEPPGKGPDAVASASDEFTDEFGRRWRKIHKKRGSGWIDKCIRVG